MQEIIIVTDAKLSLLAQAAEDTAVIDSVYSSTKRDGSFKANIRNRFVNSLRRALGLEPTIKADFSVARDGTSRLSIRRQSRVMSRFRRHHLNATTRQMA